MNNKIGNWSIRKTFRNCVMLLILLCASSAIAGITTVEPGYEEWRWGAAGQNTSGKWADGTSISIDDVSFARLDALIEAGGYINGRHVTEGKYALTGYTLENKGEFNYDGFGESSPGGIDGGYPIEHRYDRENYPYFKIQGKISVPETGKWTFCICASDMTLLKLTLSKNGSSVFDEEITPYWYNGHILRVIELEAGEYDLEFRQFSVSQSVYYEISAALGELSTFSRPTFELITAPQVLYTVTFDSAGGSAVDSQQVVGGRVAVEPDAPFFAGHAFQFWTADPSASIPAPFDFTSIVEESFTLTAVWRENSMPVVQPISVTPARVFLNGSSAKFTLSADASDADVGDVLTYSWTVVDEPSVALSISSPDAASTEVTAFGAGTFTFQVVVSDGHEWVSERVDVAVEATADPTTFSFVGAEYTESQNWLPTGSNAYDHSDPKYAWEYAKSEWRSTGTSAKAYLIDNKRENAYGLDGYVFPGKCEVQSGDSAFNISSGTEYFDETEGVHTLVFSNVTEYVSSFEFYPKVTRGYIGGTTFCQLGTEAQEFAMDDPRQPVGESVPLFRPGSFAIKLTEAQKNEFVPFAKITFSGKVGRHAKIRVGILASGNSKFKPQFMSVGGATAEWGGQRNSQPGMPDFLFFDIDNAKSGGTAILSLKQPDNQWDTAILNGVIFDSIMKKPGFAIVVR